VIKELEATGAFTTMTRRQDEDEHSLEMHLPYIYAILHFSRNNESTPAPLLVPIMVGSTNVEKEKEYGKLLAPYLAQKENLFVISSDFCHWYVSVEY
jgi:MEMO1 family protein